MEDKNLEKTVNTRSVTPAEVAYRDGYITGQVKSEQQQRDLDRIRYENQTTRESESAASGLLTGIILTALIGSGIAAYFLISQAQKIPVVKSTTPQIQKETKVIEKTTDRVREVSPPAVPNVAVPNVEVTVPSPVQPSGTTQPTQAPPPAEKKVEPSNSQTPSQQPQQPQTSPNQ
jgi:hypothetical protein